jgi:hypothetical protein
MQLDVAREPQEEMEGDCPSSIPHPDHISQIFCFVQAVYSQLFILAVYSQLFILAVYSQLFILAVYFQLK